MKLDTVPASKKNSKPSYCNLNFLNDDIYQDVISTKAFRRLEGITFLGALGLTEKIGKKKDISRAQHSINVATLAYKISRKRDYDQELTKHLVVAGLLHDIGHFPLSHSVESYLSKKLQVDHHALGNLIIDGEFEALNDLNKILKDNFDISFLKALLEKEVDKDLGGDLFSSSFNIDTIDGIYQSGLFIGNNLFDPDELINEVYLKNEDFNYAVLDNFWKSKNFIYNQFIHSNFCLFVDTIGELFFKKNKYHLDFNDLLSVEKSWKKKFFFMNLLKNLDSSSLFSSHDGQSFYLPKEIDDETNHFYKKRKYLINKDEKKLSSRYIYLKDMKKCKKFSVNIPTENLCLF
ncbi:HD domain-containing protein [Acinetobacter lactucae]|uniref:HD domain-containing protein n=1 Tax=Acinetobacter lactucae TaxID=1785128 RepID=UPI000F7B756F|nr:HD domain-containing protein [Acinetobacter lactucae]RSO33395.1 HD domain-containing protein [Acinetobacter lactucae]